MQEKLNELRQKLEDQEEHRQQLREYLYEAKLERSQVKKQQMELTFQGGLLTTPLLMFDYDETLEISTIKRAHINDMKKNIKHLNQRISQLQLQGVPSLSSNLL